MPLGVPRPRLSSRRAGHARRGLGVAGLTLMLCGSCKTGCELLHPRRHASTAARVAVATKRDCASSDWVCYGHDAQRTSTSPGRCTGPLRELWHFRPDPPNGRKATLFHAIATSDAVYASGVIGESPAVYRIGLDGQQAWVFDTRVDISHAQWPLFAHNHVVLDDDGVYILNPQTGTKLFDRGLDWWGQAIADPARLYLVNEWHVDGPPVLVGAFDPEGHDIWQQNVSGTVREDVQDAVGAIALDQGTLFQAVEYRYIPFWGLFAFDAATGHPRWTVDVHPTSAISAGSGKVYLVEREGRGQPESLAARSERTGELVWRSPVQRLDETAPALVSDLVLTFSHEDGLSAWDEADGHARWTRFVVDSAGEATEHATHIAVAAGSRTLVVAIGSTLAVLDLKDGRELWRSDEPDGSNPHLHSPVIAHGRVYLMSDTGLRAFACATEDP